MPLQGVLHLSKILVPVDFSPASHAAVLQAGILARHCRSELTLLHVDEIPLLLTAVERLGIGEKDWEGAVAEQSGRRKNQLEMFAGAGLEGIPVNRVMRVGDPAHEIVHLATEIKADLILMPTHGFGPIRRLLLGSVAAKVLRDAACPVWTEARQFKPVESGPGIWRRVICGLRSGPEAARALSWAAEFTADFQAELIVAHAILLTQPEAIYPPKGRDEAIRSAEERLGNLVSALQVKPEIAILDGPAPDALGEAVRAFNAELLVIARGRSPGLIGRLSSETYDIIRCSPCGVVSV